MKQKADIIKYAAVIVDEIGRYLIVKDKQETFWKNVGGKPEVNETPESCLTRELFEELGVTVKGIPKYYFSCPITQAANNPNLTVEIILYSIEIEGIPKPSSEIGEIHWLTKEEFLQNKYLLTSQLTDFIVPKLIHDTFLK
jgi:8-oxo-dGTP diphosphatase